MSRGPDPRHTKLELMVQMRGVAAKVGRPPTADEFNEHSDEGFTSNHIYRAWSDRSWCDILELMEFDRDRIEKSRYVYVTEEELVEDFWKVAYIVKRPPMNKDIQKHGQYSPPTFKKMFECERWDDVLETFGMERVNLRNYPPRDSRPQLV